MSELDLYLKKLQAQLDEWKAELDKQKARASGLSADVQLEVNKQIKAFESRLEQAKTKLSELSEVGEDAWVAVRADVESAWDSLKSAVSAMSTKRKG